MGKGQPRRNDDQVPSQNADDRREQDRPGAHSQTKYDHGHKVDVSEYAVIEGHKPRDPGDCRNHAQHLDILAERSGRLIKESGVRFYIAGRSGAFGLAAEHAASVRRKRTAEPGQSPSREDRGFGSVYFLFISLGRWHRGCSQASRASNPKYSKRSPCPSLSPLSEK